jgi:hypothetical protein
MKLICLLLFITGCSFIVGGKEAPKTAKNSRYKITFDNSSWKQKQDNRSDYIYQNTDGRIMLSNSFCDEFQEQPLDHLAQKTFNSIKNFTSSTEKYTAFHDREAYRLVGKGEVDGVQVNLRLLNTRRDNCYFDFLAISPEGTDRNEKAFDEFLRSVEFK